MKRPLLIISSLLMMSIGAIAQSMSGTYSNYSTFAAAIEAVSTAGVSGEVIFEMAPGTYNEFVSIGEIPGVSETNRVRFKGMGNDNRQVVITSNAGYTQKPTVKLDNADYISFENMTITTTSTNYANLVVLDNHVNHIYFDNVVFQGTEVNVSTTNNDKHLVYDASRGVTDSDLRFTNCTFNDGFIALYMSGENIYIHDEGLVVENCSFYNQFSKSIYMTFQDRPIIRGNVIVNDKDLKNGYQGIDGYRCYYDGIVENNVVNISYAQCNATGIELRPAMGDSLNYFVIRNNMVRIHSNASSNYCYIISFNSGENINFAHNTGLLTGEGSGSTLFVNNNVSKFNIYNNLLVNEMSGQAIWVKSTTATNRICDYNRIALSSTAKVGKYGTIEYATLDEWRSATGFDANTALSSPSFASANDLHLTAPDGLLVANPLSYVTYDIDGNTRSNTPCAGADEYTNTNMPPVVAQQISAITFNEYPQSTTIPLNGVFTDPDDPDEDIVVTITSVSNQDLISAEIDGSNIIITRLVNQAGNVVITLRATSDGQYVETPINVTCHRYDQPPYIAQQLNDIVFTEYPQQLQFDLTGTFADPDDDDQLAITIEETPEYIIATIDGTMLTVIRMSPAAIDDEVMTLRATSNSLFVEMDVNISADAVAIEMSTATFDDVTLGSTGVWEPECGYNQMVSASWSFTNFYDPSFWGGFTTSNHSDLTATGLNAQYTAITGKGYQDSEQYAVAYTFGAETKVTALDGSSNVVEGCYVTNNLWAYQSITEGDYMSSAFGGETGNDPDYFLLFAVGRDANNQVTDTAFFYLADYRFDDNSLDYVVDTWQWFDLSVLGEVSSIRFGLESSKNNEWGMLTPAYFCMDDFFGSNGGSNDQPPYIAQQLNDIVFTEYPQQLQYDLTNVFADPDEGDELVLSVEVVPEHITATIDGTMLTVTRMTPAAIDDEVMTLRATSNSLFVEMDVNISADAVAIEMSTATFDDVVLGNSGVWEPECGYNQMISASWSFTNFYDPSYWGGFTTSNHSDLTATGLDAQYTAITGKGYQDSEQYAVAYTFGVETKVSAIDGSSNVVEGCYVTNNLWAYQSITEGDFMSSAFGGETGNDPDYFLLFAVGRDANNQVTDTAFFYLADYRFDDNSLDYVVDTWQWFDLSVLGEVSSISFGLESSKNNEWGMLTPAYFCMDDFFGSNGGNVGMEEDNIASFTLYPNPATGRIIIDDAVGCQEYKICDLQGRVLLRGMTTSQAISIEGLDAGLYIIVLSDGDTYRTSKFVKK